MPKVVVSKGGQTINITQEQERRAQSLLQSFQRKGKLPTATGRNPSVLKRFGFLLGEFQEGRAAVGVPSRRLPVVDPVSGGIVSRGEFTRDIRKAEVEAFLRAAPGEIIRTPGLLGLTQQEIASQERLRQQAQQEAAFTQPQVAPVFFKPKEIITGTDFSFKDFIEQSRQREVPAKPQLIISPTAPSGLSFFEKKEFFLEEAKEREREIRLKEDLEFGEGVSSRISSFGLGATGAAIGTGLFFKGLVTQPITTGKGIIGSLFGIAKDPIKTGRRVITTAKEDPFAFAGAVAFETGTIFGGGKILTKTSDFFGVQKTKISPKFVPLTDDVIDIPEGPRIEVVGGVGDVTETLPSQIALSGKEVTAVSGQRNLFGLFDKDIVVRKPIQNEASLLQETKNLLKKFDDGTISSSELIKLNNQLAQQGRKGILETSFFADPRGRLRTSRLGVEEAKTATFSDIIKGDFKFLKDKSQAIVFENTKIADFPTNLRNIANKIKSGKKLTELENLKLLEWQLAKTGQFKPLGFLGRESEITLAPGEIIQKGKKVAVTLINGKPVSVFSSKVGKISVEGQKLLDKVKAGTATADDVSKLNKILIKETGFSNPLGVSQPVLSTSQISSTAIASGVILPQVVSRGVSVTPTISSFFGTPSITSRVTPSKPSKAPSIGSFFGGTPSSVGKPSPTVGSFFGTPSGISSATTRLGIIKRPPPVRPPVKTTKPKDDVTRLIFGQDISRREDKVQEYKLQIRSSEKQPGKIVKWVGTSAPRKLTKLGALSRGSRITDNTTASAFRVFKTKNLITRPQKKDLYWIDHRRKFREFKVSPKGKKGKQLAENTFIEKRAFRIDSVGERRGIPFLGQRVRKQKAAIKKKEANISSFFGTSNLNSQPKKSKRRKQSSIGKMFGI